MRKFVVGIITACAAVAGCSDTGAAEKAVRGMLKDPDSAEFRNLRVVDKPSVQEGVVCGEVNAKNSYGGYNGFKEFAFNPNSGAVTIVGDEGTVSDDTVMRMCS
jgi:hypothetical protein